MASALHATSDHAKLAALLETSASTTIAIRLPVTRKAVARDAAKALAMALDVDRGPSSMARRKLLNGVVNGLMLLLLLDHLLLLKLLLLKELLGRELLLLLPAAGREMRE